MQSPVTDRLVIAVALPDVPAFQGLAAARGPFVFSMCREAAGAERPMESRSTRL